MPFRGRQAHSTVVYVFRRHWLPTGASIWVTGWKALDIAQRADDRREHSNKHLLEVLRRLV